MTQTHTRPIGIMPGETRQSWNPDAFRALSPTEARQFARGMNGRKGNRGSGGTPAPATPPTAASRRPGLSSTPTRIPAATPSVAPPAAKSCRTKAARPATNELTLSVRVFAQRNGHSHLTLDASRTLADQVYAHRSAHQ